MSYILALDQGTTSSRALLFDQHQREVARSQREFTPYYPQPGWVEHDAEEIWQSQREVMEAALERAGVKAGELAAIGITNQRETTVIWDRSTGRPIHRAIVWQCRRTAALCEQLAQETGFAQHVRQATGLLLDAYFSATKVAWTLNQVAGARERAAKGELLFGTIDSWLIWQLTGEHVTDYSNAARTMLFNINTLDWDPDILRTLDIPRAMLPRVVDSSGVCAYASIHGTKVPIAGIAGDQHAALFGQACFRPGMAKNTYGTGCFLMMQTGQQRKESGHNLLSTIAWSLNGQVSYALEGSVFVAGAVVQWLRDELRLLDDARDSAFFAQKVPDTNGVYLVPAFVGLGAPYWDMHARGTITGLTRGANRYHIIRAALEAIAYQSRDLLDCMAKDNGTPLSELRVDGGASLNDFLMQFQADIGNLAVVRPQVAETTALGAALLAGLAVGWWTSLAEIEACWQADRRFEVTMPEERRAQLYAGWGKAVAAARGKEAQLVQV